MLIDLQTEKKEVRSRKLPAKKKGRGLIEFSRILRNPVSEWDGCSGCSIAWFETKNGSQSCRIPREDCFPYGQKGGQGRGWPGEEEGQFKLLSGHAEKIGGVTYQESSGKKQLELL